MSKIINIPDIQDKMYQKLTETGWQEPLRWFLKGSDFEDILHKLVDDVQEGHRFTPKVGDIFNAFIMCPLDTVRVVIIGQDPYPQLGVADGIAFSCSNSKYPEASLRYILNEINETIYSGKLISTDINLARWAQQGVLLLNTALTTRIGKPGTHKEIWKPFTSHVLDFLHWNNPGLIYVLLGKEAQSWESVIGDNNYILKASHPASAAYSKSKDWQSNDVFNEVNKLLGKQELPEIVW